VPLGGVPDAWVGDLAVWKLDGPAFAGAISDPVEAWLRCGPIGAHHTVVAGRLLVEAGLLVNTALADKLSLHRRVSERFQAA
jgi:hypothetical protein